MSRAEEFIDYLKNFIGSPYAWGAEGPSPKGFDCSGLMLEGLRAFGLWGANDTTAQGLYDHFKSQPGIFKPGAFVFFGKDNKSITHVGVCINNWQYLEAGGGGKTTVNVGMVRIRPITWRKDLVAVLDVVK